MKTGYLDRKYEMLVALLKDPARSRGFSADLARLDHLYGSFPYLVAARRCHDYEAASDSGAEASDDQLEHAVTTVTQTIRTFNDLCQEACAAPFCAVDASDREALYALAGEVAEEIDAQQRERRGRMRHDVLVPDELGPSDLDFVQDRDDRLELGTSLAGKPRVDVERAWHNRYYSVALSCPADDADQPPADRVSLTCRSLVPDCLDVSVERAGRDALVASVQVPRGLRFGAGELDFLRQRVDLAAGVLDFVTGVLRDHYPHLRLDGTGFQDGLPWRD